MGTCEGKLKQLVVLHTGILGRAAQVALFKGSPDGFRNEINEPVTRGGFHKELELVLT